MPQLLPLSSSSNLQCFAVSKHYAYCVTKHAIAFRRQTVSRPHIRAADCFFHHKQTDRQAQRLWLVATPSFSHRSALVFDPAQANATCPWALQRSGRPTPCTPNLPKRCNSSAEHPHAAYQLLSKKPLSPIGVGPRYTFIPFWSCVLRKKAR